MGDAPGWPSESPTRPSVLWRLRHSPATGGIAMLLFLVPAGLWLLAAASAQVGDHSGPSGMMNPSLTPFHMWFVIGVIGTVLALGSLVQVGRTLAEQRDWTQPGVRRRLLAVAVATCVGIAVEFLLLHFVTAHELAIAPYFQSGEGTVAIAVLAVGQPVLVGALALLCCRLLPVRRLERHRRTLRPSAWIGMLGIVGMAASCGAVLFWGDRNGTLFFVHPSFLGAIKGSRNFGAWWPGLFAAMAALTVVAVACAPGFIWRADRGAEPVVPSMSAESVGPAVVGR